MIGAEVLHEFQPGGRREDGQKDSMQLSWSVRRSPTTGCQEELCVVGKRVLWLEGLHPAARSLSRVYSLDSEVLQAFWGQFEQVASEGGSGGKQVMRCVCVRESSCLTLFMETGAIHHVPLPFPVRWVWPVVGGILLERQVPPDVGTDGLPTFFTLFHPMDDLCPVTFRRPTATAADVTVLGFVSDPHQRVIHSSLAPPLLVCHDSILGRHSVWAVQPAKTEDIPAHVGTPARPYSSTATPQHPLSVSAPSCYSHMTPVGPLNTPVEMILSVRKQMPAVPDTLKLPVLAQLQRGSPYLQLGGSGGRGGGREGVKVGSVVKVGSGRSPFISRLQTPQSGAVQAMKRSKSLSPPLLARISPFSQTVNSRSWSTFYSEESLGEVFEPLIPQACLHLLWQEKDEGGERFSSDAASAVFTTSDFMGSSYLVMVMSSLSQLWLLQYSTIGDTPPSFSCPTLLPALQALPLPRLAMMLVMDPSKQLVLYSGHTRVSSRVAAVDSHSLTCEVPGLGPSGNTQMSEPAVIDGIQDPIEDSFTVVLGSGRMLRCCLQPLERQLVATLHLHALREILPTETSRELLADFYSSAHGLRGPAVLSHLHCWLLASIGVPPSKVEEKVNSKLPSSPWQRVQAMADAPSFLNAVPALRLFKAARTGRESQIGATSPPVWSPLATETTVSLQSHAYSVIFALHLTYEEMKLNTLHHPSLEQVAGLLHRLASHLGLSSYVDHYQRDFPALFLQTHPSGAAQFSEDSMEEGLEQAAPPPSPPHIMQWLQQKLRDKPVQPFPVLPTVCKRTAQLTKLFGLYTAAEGEPVELSSLVQVVGGSQEELSGEQFTALQAKASSPYERVVLCLVQEGLRLSDLESLPVGVCLPIWDCVVHCQEAPPPSWPPEAYDIIGRTDVAKSLNMNTSTFALKMEKPEKDDDGMDIDQEILSLRFPKDLRVNEVRRLLTSSKPVRITLTQKPEVSDHAFIEQQESHLLTICQRTMALPVGRGMFSLATTQPLPTAPLAIPTFNLNGRAPPRNSTVSLEHIDIPANMSDWAEFHNGVAAGLRIAPGISKLDSTWMVFHSTRDDCPNSYAGFLMALGLQGHLAELSDFHLYEFLQEKHELTVIGLLVGVAAARLGSTNASLYSLLSIYLPPLQPFGAADMEVSHLMQTAAVVGVGLLYLASGNRHLVEVMLREIGRSPGPELEFAENRESYSLAAGLALGMITLGQGGSLLGLSDLGLSDKLCLYMNGGPKNKVAMTTTPVPSNLVLEGDQVNTHVTAPGAIVALGLMYLKTNDSAIATRLDAPATQYELDSIRSDFLMLRALSRGLIMWDEVEPTQRWISSHVPQLVHEYAFKGSRASKDYNPSIDYQTVSQAYVNITAGCCLAMGLRYAGTCNHRAYQCLLENVKYLLSRLDSSVADQAGKPCLESCLNAVVLALSVVMCGSGDLEVLRLMRRLHSRVGHPEVHYGSHMAIHMGLGLLFLGGGRYSLSRSNVAIAMLLCALFPKFPNSSGDNRYHLQALRHLYVLAAEPRVEVCSPLYWPVKLELSKDRESTGQVLSKSGTIFVKQRVTTLPQGGNVPLRGHHPSTMLPAALSSQCYGIMKVKGKLNLLDEELSRDPLVKALVKHTVQLSEEDSEWSRFASAALLECVSQEKMQVLTTYLQLEQTVTKLPQLQPMTHLWQLKLAGVLGTRTTERGKSCFLLSREYTDSLLMRLKNFVEEASQQYCHETRLDKLLSWYLLPDHHPRPDFTEREAALLALTLLTYDIPPHHQLQLTPQTTVPELYGMLNNLHVPVAAVVRLLPLLLPQTLQ